MNILDPNQMAILQGIRDGSYRGAVPFEQLASEVNLMLALRIIEPSGVCPYRLTEAGSRILALASEQRRA